MHMEADLLDSTGDIGASGHQVLEGPDEAPKLSRISNRRPKTDRDLGLRFHERRDHLTVHHASALRMSRVN
jgi:hypothetical protein